MQSPARPPLFYLGLPGACISSFPACSPPPPSHVSTFSRHHAAPRPALFPPSPWVSSHRLSRQDFFSRPDGAHPLLPHRSRISNPLGLKMQTHRKLFFSPGLPRFGGCFTTTPRPLRLFIRSCFGEAVGCPPLFSPASASGQWFFSILNKFCLRTRSFCPLYAVTKARSYRPRICAIDRLGLPMPPVCWRVGLAPRAPFKPFLVDGACT